MSIPPLVCSTPPPPDQCEDDKDTEDYDIQYSLSQDEDDDSNEYNYGNISAYASFKTIPEINNKIELPNIPIDNIEINNTPPSETYNEIATTHITNDINTKVEDDILEDLDLEIDKFSINSGKTSQTDGDENHSEGSPKAINEEEERRNVIEDEIIETKIFDETFQPFVENISHSDSELVKEISVEPHSSEEIRIQESVEDNFGNVISDVISNCSKNLSNVEKDEIVSHSPSHDDINIENSTNNDDDFGDFDDFKFVSSDIPTTSVVESCDNPWGNEEGSNSFQANFEKFEPENTETNFQVANESKAGVPEIEDDDDFGDFDDFKSSSIECNVSEGHESHAHQESMLNLLSNENIENVLSSIFEFDISDTETQFEGKLESSLGETWGHLMDIEVRQPYMVNWNYSLGQKTLLKALCIDSRNILFGPKWFHNMPKYAANLSAAPLQPQKPMVSANTSQSEANPEKPNKKTADTWADPFTADGKEFTYAEALLLDLEHLMATLDQMAHNHSTLKISDLLSHACNVEGSKTTPQLRSSDPSALDPSMPTKPENIYSSSPNVQPLRQISLPDTHIFTPTDSQIPRSKTIHHDIGNPVLMPDAAAVEDADDEYSDFQDFKTSENDPPKHSKAVTRSLETSDESPVVLKPTESSIPFHTSLLQPIKMVPIVPTLNWPDPGQVKETFEDFSDFVSNSPWPSENQEPTRATFCADETENSEICVNISNCATINESKASEQTAAKTSDGNDDDFDTFQSAVPVMQSIRNDLCNMTIPPFNNKSAIQDVNSTKPSGDFDIGFSNLDKSENIKQNNKSLPKSSQEEFSQFNQTHIPNNINSKSQTPHSFKNSPTSTPVLQTTAQVLQPTPASSGIPPSKAASGQILQPLSLEGFSQINWPNPGSLNLQDLSRFNPVETLPSLKNEVSSGSHSKNASPAHSIKSKVSDDDWGDFVSSRPKHQPVTARAQPSCADDDEWTDFVSSPTLPTQNGLNTISFNVHSNLNMQKSANPNKYKTGRDQTPLDIPTLNYVTPKSNNHKLYSDRHFQNL